MRAAPHLLARPSTFYLVTILTASWIVTNFGFIAYRTNDDVVLSALASGAVTGTSEFALIYSSPLLGWMLRAGYYLAPNFDWYGFTMFSFQLGSLSIVSATVWKTSSKATVRFLKISFLFFLLPRFLFPMQFTSAAMITVFAGVVMIFHPIHRPTQRSWQIFSGYCLIVFGVGFRPEAGYLMILVLSICLSVLTAFESLRAWRKSLLKIALLPGIGLGMVLLDRWNSAESPTHSGAFATTKLLSLQSPPIEVPDLDFYLLKSTGGWYFDTSETAQELGLLDKQIGYFIPNLISVRETIGDLISRPYFSFMLTFILVFGLVIVNRETSWRRAAGFGFVILAVITSSAVLLDTRFGRMPYRLAMPLWVVGVLLMLIFPPGKTTKSDSTQQTTIFAVVNGISTFSKMARAMISIYLAASLLFCAVGIRYFEFALERHAEATNSVKNRILVWDCLQQEGSLIFHDVRHSGIGFGGDYVSSANISYFRMKVIDNGWLLHTEPYRERVRQFGLDPDRSLVQSLVEGSALFVSSPETVSLLANLYESKTSRLTATPRATEVCGVKLWKIIVTT